MTCMHLMEIQIFITITISGIVPKVNTKWNNMRRISFRKPTVCISSIFDGVECKSKRTVSMPSIFPSPLASFQAHRILIDKLDHYTSSNFHIRQFQIGGKFEIPQQID